jgi:predicted aconitase with swiveling domain
VLAAGHASGCALVLAEPLSFWGGLDPDDGRISDRRHPQHGEVVTGRILVLPSGRGSSSSSSVLAESLRLRTAPAGIILRHADPIMVLGALVAEDLYGIALPVVLLDEADYGSIRTMDRVAITLARVTVESGGD